MCISGSAIGNIRSCCRFCRPIHRAEAGVDDRRVIGGIDHALHSGGRWLDAPEVYGPRKTLYNLFVGWNEKGVWKNGFSPYRYKGRNVIERMFAKLKAFRRIAIRYDRNAGNFMPALCLTATVCDWVKA